MLGLTGRVVVLSLGAALPVEGAHAMQVTVRSHERRVLYHSPETPGYTCWSGIWMMPDGSVMVCFTQVTGALGNWRPRAPQEVLRRMPTAQQENPAYDFTGLAQHNVYLRSTDAGQTWTQVSADPFSSCLNGMCGGGAAALADGTILRAAWGQSLTYGAQTWGPPEYLSSDPHLQTFPTRIRRLRGGRTALTGGAGPYDPETWTWMAQLPKIRPCLWVSRDADCRAWSDPLYIAPEGVNYAGEEWDLAELDNGDLLAVLRTATYDAAGNTVSQERRQSILTKRGDIWEPGPITSAPFPHSGHPELLRTREGVILHIAQPGLAWTADRGATWTPLDCPGTAYYPHAVQLDDGTVLIVSHIGSDDPYGKVDQSVVLDELRLAVE
jgi:hypothetical protein